MHRQLTNILIATLLLLSGTVDLLTHWKIGPVSLEAIVTAIATVFVWILAFSSKTRWTQFRAIWPLVAFVAWATMSLACLWLATPDEVTISSFQNVLLFLLFLGVIILSAQAARSDPRFHHRCAIWLERAIMLTMICGMSAFVWSMIGARSFAMVALLGMVWHTVRWRNGARSSMLLVVLLYITLFFTLSRTAIAVATLVCPCLKFYRPGFLFSALRLGFASAVCCAVLAYVVSTFAPLQQRFFEGDTSLEVGGYAINTEGRMDAWSNVWASFLDSPIIGKGPGTASVPRLVGNLNHPHNDYLRILHDYGLIGGVMWLASIVAVCRKAHFYWKHSLLSPEKVCFCLSALGGAGAISLAMITDNPIVYWFVMLPLGVIVGTFFGLTDDRVGQSRAEVLALRDFGAKNHFIGKPPISVITDRSILHQSTLGRKGNEKAVSFDRPSNPPSLTGPEITAHGSSQRPSRKP